MADCPICKVELETTAKWRGGKSFTCPNCGRFRMTDEAILDLPYELRQNGDSKRAVLSHHIRRSQREGDDWMQITNDLAKRVAAGKLPNAAQQGDNLVQWLGVNSEAPGEFIQRPLDHWTAIVGTLIKHDYVGFIGTALEHEDLLIGNHTMGFFNWCLSFQGWQRFEELQRGRADTNKAFMAMQYGEDQLDKVYRECFMPAAEQAGFRLTRLDEEPRAGLIDDRLRVEIRTSAFLVADLTHGNRGAYWEAGYAEGLGKPVIYTCEKSVFDDKTKGPHFDTNHHQTIVWDQDDLATALIDLKATVRASLPELAKLEDD